MMDLVLRERGRYLGLKGVNDYVLSVFAVFPIL
jgi:hypothetical protein